MCERLFITFISPYKILYSQSLKGYSSKNHNPLVCEPSHQGNGLFRIHQSIMSVFIIDSSNGQNIDKYFAFRYSSLEITQPTRNKQKERICGINIRWLERKWSEKIRQVEEEGEWEKNRVSLAAFRMGWRWYGTPFATMHIWCRALWFLSDQVQGHVVSTPTGSSICERERGQKSIWKIEFYSKNSGNSWRLAGLYNGL